LWFGGLLWKFDLIFNPNSSPKTTQQPTKPPRREGRTE
jgi:hypothetical protein